MPRELVKIIGILAIFLVIAACVNLKQLSEFSTSSIEGIEKFDDISSSFSKICLEDCQQKNISELNIHSSSCECSADREADSITRLIYGTVQNYFYGLQDISKNEITQYQTEGLTQALSAGDFGPLQLKEKDVKAYSGVSSLILKAFTDGYRRKKVKEYVREGHPHLQVLLHFLNQNIEGSLKGKLEVQKSSIKGYYFDLVMDEDLSVYERTKFAEDYFRRISEIEERQQELDTYSEILETISTAHTALNANIDSLNFNEVGLLLENYGQLLHTATVAIGE
ncbi:MAG: hypothetical protein ACR2MT_13945 [Aurantibacter sp.]